MVKKAGVALQVLFYLAAGINHFVSPDGYLRIIPHYLPFPETLNLLAGFFEVLLAVLLAFPKTRWFGARGIILLLIAFLPVHITMIGDAPLQVGKIMVTPLIAWVRLVVLQPLLILWVWWAGKRSKS